MKTTGQRALPSLREKKNSVSVLVALFMGDPVSYQVNSSVDCLLTNKCPARGQEVLRWPIHGRRAGEQSLWPVTLGLRAA